MKTRRHAWAVLLAAVSLLVLVPAAAARADRPAAQAATVSVQILGLSEFHGALAPPGGSGGRIGSVDAGGVEYLATHLKQLEATNPNTITVASGDNIGASPLVSALFHDEPTIDAFDAIGVDYSSVGNHEFDEGLRELRRMQNGGCHPTDGCRFANPFTGASFRYLAANVVVPPTAAQIRAVARYNAKQRAKLRAHQRFCKTRKNARKPTCTRRFRIKLRPAPTATPVFPPYAIRSVGGVRVGFIGEVLQSAPTIVVPTAVAGLRFLPEASTANRYAAILKAQGVRAIVLLIHQGNASASEPSGCGPSGDLTPIVDALSNDIDVVVSGHTAGAYVCQQGTKLVTQASGAGRLITKIDLGIDTGTGEVVSKSARNVIVTRDVPKDPALTTIVTQAQQLSAPLANRVIGSIQADITRTANAAGESALGDVIADAQLAATRDAAKGSAVVAFMNPGGIRADLSFNQISGGEQPGQVTYGEAFTVQPFGNTLVVKTMTGDMIKRLLEQQFDNPSTGSDRVLQVSNGFAYTYARSAPAGSRVSSITLNGQPVVATQSYRLTMNSFLADGGDGFTVFREGTNTLGGEVDLDALEAYFRASSPVAPGPRNRITRVG